MNARDLLFALMLLAIPALLARMWIEAPKLGPPIAVARCAIPVEHKGRGVACVTSGTAGAGMAPARLQAWQVPIDLNRASPAELASLDGVGAKLAARIVAARPFAEVRELARVRGIGRKRLEALTPRLSTERR
jgi:hypothetical protein